MLLKGLSINIGGKDCRFVLDKDRYLFIGQNSEKCINIIEHLLVRDAKNTIAEVDTDMGNSAIVFSMNDATIVGNKNTVKVSAELPLYHCIRYVKDDMIRSTLYTGDDSCKVLEYNLTQYDDSILTDAQWMYLTTVINDFVGYPMLSIGNNILNFAIIPKEDLSVAAQKSVYMLFAEAMLTPKDTDRIFLLSEIKGMSEEYLNKLLLCLTEMRGTSICLGCLKEVRTKSLNNIEMIEV